MLEAEFGEDLKDRKAVIRQEVYQPLFFTCMRSLQRSTFSCVYLPRSSLTSRVLS